MRQAQVVPDSRRTRFMHELSVALDIVKLIEAALGAKKPLVSVHLTLGPLSGICPDSLRFCFQEIAGQEGFGAPELVMNQTAARVHCHDCGLDYETKEFFEGCPQCHSMNRTVESGDEFTVDYVEIEEE